MPKEVAKLRWTIERAASEFQIDRKTLTKRIRAGDIEPGEDGKFSTEQICAAVFGDYRSEQLRELRGRADKVELENECTRKERIPMDIVRDVNDSVEQEIAAIIKTSGLSTADCNRIYEQLRDIPNRLKW